MASVNIKAVKKPEGGLSSYTSTDINGSEDMTGTAGVKERWKHLTKKQQWDCLVALRGPDITNSELIKHFTTGVIRKEMGKFMRVGGQLSEIPFVVVSSGRVFESTSGPVKPDLNHFLQHVYEAADILDIPIIILPPYIWEDMMITGTHTKATIYLLNYLSKNKSTVASNTYQTYVTPLLSQYALYLKESK